ncbi:MAG: hypothetical protein BWK78_07610 [Thiotrichaceae bacterium IS1]|nr:MAG: hypothetical protein BWK78_07610 [Thiotrichaceae bacterium IS1]
MEIFELLEQIRQRPALYLSGNSIRQLKSFLDGYYWCRHSLGVPKSPQDQHWFQFQSWIAKKYSIRSSQSWAQIILFFANDEFEALQHFFELWEEFLREPGKPP